MKYLSHLEKIFLCILVLLAIINISFNARIPLMILALIILVLSFKHLGIAFKYATIFFFILGLILLTTNGFSWLKLAKGTNSMTNLIVLLIVMQLFTIPIQIGHYQESIINLVNNKLSNSKKLFIFTMLITFLLSSILSMGTVPIIYSVLGTTLEKRLGYNYHQFSSIAISRAFTLGTLWAPGAATLFLISSIIHVPLQNLFFPSLILGILGLFLSYFLSRKSSFMNDQNDVTTHYSNFDLKKDIKKISQIFIAVILLLIIAFTLIKFKIGEAMVDVTIAGIIVVVLWIILLQHKQTARQETLTALKKYYQKGILTGGSLASFFIAIGLFSTTFESSNISKLIENRFTPFISSLSWSSLLLIPLLVVLLALIGIHPLASITLLGQIMMGIHLPFSHLAIALALNIGSVLAYMTSPFAGIVVVIANIIHENTYTVSLKWNGKFCLILFVLSLIFIICYTSYFSFL